MPIPLPPLPYYRYTVTVLYVLIDLVGRREAAVTLLFLPFLTLLLMQCSDTLTVTLPAVPAPFPPDAYGGGGECIVCVVPSPPCSREGRVPTHVIVPLPAGDACLPFYHYRYISITVTLLILQ